MVDLPPELCVILVAAPLFRAAQMMPSVLHRLEAFLLAAQLRDRIAKEIGNPDLLTVPAGKVVEAMTSSRCQEGFSLESLETLGDCVLKMAVSATLYAERSEDHEGLLSKRRAKEVCNAALFHRTRALGIDVRLGAGEAGNE